MIVMSVTVAAVGALGGGMTGWRTVAVIYAVIFLIFNSLASLTCKEVADDWEEADSKGKASSDEKVSF